MKSRRIFAVILFSIMYLSLCSCDGGYMDLFWEAPFLYIGEAWSWFFGSFTPMCFEMISEIWGQGSIVGFIVALVMTVGIFLSYVIVLLLFLFIIVIIVAIALIPTVLWLVLALIGLLIWALAELFEFLGALLFG